MSAVLGSRRSISPRISFYSLVEEGKTRLLQWRTGYPSIHQSPLSLRGHRRWPLPSRNKETLKVNLNWPWIELCRFFARPRSPICALVKNDWNEVKRECYSILKTLTEVLNCVLRLTWCKTPVALHVWIQQTTPATRLSLALSSLRDEVLSVT